MPPVHKHSVQSALGMGSDHALVIHVWYLDVLDDLVEAATNLPETTDQFLTIPTSFSTAQQEMVAQAFPRAKILTVENIGQDVGALFQLMKQVDLGRYDFICKIHTKKGPDMPHEWRRALLDGVLGAQQQVRHIIDRFRSDPQVMLAGARQLYVHGPSYLEPNAEGVGTIFGEMIGDFGFRAGDWGFVAGTCFWIRTAILQEMAACPLDFQPSSSATDEVQANAAERMFGLAVSARGGKVLLQDLRFPDRLPDEEHGFPNDLPRKWMRIAQILTPLAVNLFIKPYCKPVDPKALAAVAEARHRVAVFASYSPDGILPPQVIPYLEGLQPLTKAIVVVCDNDLLPAEHEKLKALATHVITGRHGEYDFGSYKRGVAWARQAGLLDQADDLILCNDSCYGPVGSFKPMFAEMETRGLDFWGVTDSHEPNYHLQTYFVVLTQRVFTSPVFKGFIERAGRGKDQQSIKKYASEFTKALTESGYAASAFVPNPLVGVHLKDPTYKNILQFPLYALGRGAPLFLAKDLGPARKNIDGKNRILSWLKDVDFRLHESASFDLDMKRQEAVGDIAFSVVMPTYNRGWCILGAISGVMGQTHSNFELIIVDDGSTDGTESKVRSNFSKEIDAGKLRYIKLPENVGVCNARNIGLAYSRNSWIAYADSDNVMRPYYLTMVASAILSNPECLTYYGQMIRLPSGTIIGENFDFEKIVKGNFIDLGVFVHHRSLAASQGVFDPSLRRLVDWDLIIRYTRVAPPCFLRTIMLDYTDDENPDRISVRESFLKANIQIVRKHSHVPSVSTIIVSYNHEDFIVEAIESALEQKGNYAHEVLLSDDGSTDCTRRIVERYADRYPRKIRNISQGKNVGISENYRHCFESAAGEFVSVLEGDDFWTDPEKNLKQVCLLREEPKASMVFSRVELFFPKSNTKRLLERHDGLHRFLSGEDFSKDANLNLIVNFSSCMFRTEIMRHLPLFLYEPRISEIGVAFYLDRLGKIGFLPEAMGVYRQNDKSVWYGAERASKLRQAIAARETALRVAKPIYRPTIQRRLDEKKEDLEKELAKILAAGKEQVV